MVPRLTRKSRVKFHRLFDRKEEGEYIIGREDTEEFIGVPEEGQAAYLLLRKGLSISEVESALKKDFGAVDVLDFAKTLLDEGFIRSIDGGIVKDRHEKVRHVLNWIRPSHVGWLFSRPAYVIYFMIILAAFAVMNIFPGYLPRYGDFFFHDSLTVIYVVSFVLGWILVAGHELSHFIAARSLGVPASFSLSNRLYFVVAETDMTDIWEVEPKRRYRAYLAGMLFDLLVMSVAVLLMYADDLQVILIGPLFYNLLKFIVLIQLLSLAWQFLFFMETDIYYVVGNFFRISDLMSDTRAYVLNLWRKARSKRPRSLDRSEREMRVIRVYSGFWAFATFITLFRFFIYQLPIMLVFFTKVFSRLGGSGWEVIDAVVFLVFFLLDYGLLIYALRKRHRQHGRKFHLGHVLHHLFHRHSRHKHR